MSHLTEYFTDFRSQAEIMVFDQPIELLKLLSNCQVQIRKSPDEKTYVETSLPRVFKGLFDIGMEDGTLFIEQAKETLSNQNAIDDQSLHDVLLTGLVPQVRISIPNTVSLLADMKGEGLLDSSVFFKDVTLRAQGKSEVFLRTKDADLVTCDHACVYIPISGGPVQLEANGASSVVLTGRISFLRSSQFNESHVFALGQIEGFPFIQKDPLCQFTHQSLQTHKAKLKAFML